MKKLSNDEMADIYQSMLKGDKRALHKLQQITLKNHLPPLVENQNSHGKVITEQNVNKRQDTNQSLISEKNKEDITVKEFTYGVNFSSNNDQMHLNALKKGAQFEEITKNQNPQKQIKKSRWINSSNRQYQTEAKENKFQKNINKEEMYGIDFSKQMKTQESSHAPKQRNSKIYVLPKISKPKQLEKVKTAQVVSPQKNISINGLQKLENRTKKSRVTFKQAIGRTKWERLQLQKRNEEERRLQGELLQYHVSTKEFLNLIKEKYGLNLNKQKYLNKVSKTQENNQINDQKQSELVQKLNPFQLQRQLQRNKCKEITQQINNLKIQFNKNNAALNNLEIALFHLPYAKYLEEKKNSISDISEEDQDVVEPLQTVDEDMRHKYKYLMANTRQKKWGLMLRTQYQSQRAQSLSRSRYTGIDSRFTQGVDNNIKSSANQQNKVTVNERLKDILFS